MKLFTGSRATIVLPRNTYSFCAKKKFSFLSTQHSTKSTDIADKWKEIWHKNPVKENQNHVNSDQKKKSFYCLSMFPYPSGILHMGHVRVYTISDVVTRFQKIRGYDVIQPMGWDAFGLPAENAAVENGISPAVWTNDNIQKMKEQMNLMGVDFDWDREFATCDPNYYQWTQKIFLLLFNHNLAYQKEAEINWDPVDQTVLANEQVNSEGRSWRSGALVEKKNLKQWFIGITKYAKVLKEDMKLLGQWPSKVKTMQNHWIGESHGAEIKFPVNDSLDSFIEVFTSRPETIFGVQYLALSIKHPLVQRKAESDPELRAFLSEHEEFESETTTGLQIKDLKASIPLTTDNELQEKFEVPVYVAPYVLSSYGKGAVMGCPGHDARDFKFWQFHNPEIPPLTVVGPKENSMSASEVPYSNKEGFLFDKRVLPNGIEDMREYHGLSTKSAASRVVRSLQSIKMGDFSVRYKLRDWLISRQRYWGAPIPIIHCNNCGSVPVPDKDLPVMLPDIEGESFGNGNPLEKMESFRNVRCPSCGGHAQRETDTMDTFMDSSWYFFRYLDSKNKGVPFDREIASSCMPVDIYIGGIEHAILHLLYSRFISKFLGDIGLWEAKGFRNEPIRKLVTQGMVHNKTYRDPIDGHFLKKSELEWDGSGHPIIARTQEKPIISYEKMSKSKHNGVDPTDFIMKHGPDATRALILFSAPVSETLNWNDDQVQGIERWLQKVLNLSYQIPITVEDSEMSLDDSDNNFFHDVEVNGKTYAKITLNMSEYRLFESTQKLLKKVIESIDVSMSLNTIISDYMKHTNLLVTLVKSEEHINSQILLDSYKKLLIAMYPVTPFISEECMYLLRERTGESWKSIRETSFPHPQEIENSIINFNVFINGKARYSFKAHKSFVSRSDSHVLEDLLKNKRVRDYCDGRIKKVILKEGIISILTHE